METKLSESLWTTKDLIRFFNCGRTAFFEAKRNGQLPPAIKIGKGNWRWDPETVRKWVRENESKVGVDPVFSNRAVTAASKRKSTVQSTGNKIKAKKGRPTKIEQMGRRK